MPRYAPALAGLVLLAGLIGLTAAARAQAADDDRPAYPTTEFAEGATSASVSAGDVTVNVTMMRKKEIDPDADVPVLAVTVAGKPVLEAAGVASGMDQPAAEASIAEIDPSNGHPEVYFTSYSGGAHCCTSVTVADEVGGKWTTVDVGEFDGDGDFLNDLDGDGLAEISTVDNSFLYQFSSYGSSAAPLVIYTVRAGKLVDVTSEPRFQEAHRDWLKQLEESVEPEERWSEPGFLAGWVAEKVRLGEGAEAWKELNEHWDLKNDEGEEVCLTGGEPEDCAKKSRAVLKFPERLKLFLEENGYGT